MEPLKEMFNKAYYQKLALHITKVYPAFNDIFFIKDVTQNLDSFSLNQRLRNTSVALQKHLPNNYKKSISILYDVAPLMPNGYTNLVYPDFVSLYGHDDFNLSMEALHYFTKFGSSEFAIREFIKRDANQTLQVMKKWARDKNHHVRRLASEGSRPRLPWSFKLDEIIKNPKLTAPILEQLKEDDELYVRKSVANHINDFTKDNKEFALQLVSKWNLKNEHSVWIVKHACRNLIKQGDANALALFNISKNVKVAIQNFQLKSNNVKLGNALEFSFDVVSEKNATQKLVVDYIIHYRKKLGDLSPKVFKLVNINLPANDIQTITKKQVLKDFTTRKHYFGEHFVEIQINGVKLAKKKFMLTN